jgi:DNA-directed RNA polymerase alpha subunit
VAPVARLRIAPVARLRVEPNIDEVQPCVANPLRRVNALHMVTVKIFTLIVEFTYTVNSIKNIYSYSMYKFD